MIRRLLRDYFSLTRGERRGMRLMLGLILALVLFRLVLPQATELLPVRSPVPDTELMAFLDYLEQSGQAPGPETSLDVIKDEKLLPKGSESEGTRVPSRPFDPNSAGLQDLVGQGIPERISRTLINYRNAGGRFRKESDLLKVYGMDSALYLQLKPFIQIEEQAVGYFQDTAGFSRIPASRELFGINSADTSQLMSIYGVGRVFSSRIVKYRDLLGGFYTHEQLAEVYGLKPKTYNEIIIRTFIDTAHLRRIDLNLTTEETLRSHPYLDPYQAESIIKYRELMGSFHSIRDLLSFGLVPDSVFLKMSPYFQVSD